MEKKLNYEEFKEAVVRDLVNYLPEELKAEKIEMFKAYKPNRILDAISMRKSRSVAPTVHLNQVYEAYEHGVAYERILRDTAAIFARELPDQDIESKSQSLTQFEQVKDRIGFQLLNTEWNKEMLTLYPSRPFLNLSLTYRIFLSFNGAGDATVAISNQLMEGWGVTEDDLYELAMEHMKKLHPLEIQGMADVAREAEEHGAPIDADELMRDEVVPMLVVSNGRRNAGACVMCSDEYMQEVGKRYGSNFYIIPSSLHEILTIPADEVTEDVRELKYMVITANQDAVAPEDQLSDSVYFYNVLTHEVTVAIE